jgi:hypothetical protein
MTFYGEQEDDEKSRWWRGIVCNTPPPKLGFTAAGWMFMHFHLDIRQLALEVKKVFEEKVRAACGGSRQSSQGEEILMVTRHVTRNCRMSSCLRLG